MDDSAPMTADQVAHAASATEEAIFRLLCQCRTEGDYPASTSDHTLRLKAAEMKANLSQLSSVMQETESRGGEVVFLGTETNFASSDQGSFGIMVMNPVQRPSSPSQPLPAKWECVYHQSCGGG